jgi:galactoside O-acetyltransferase
LRSVGFAALGSDVSIEESVVILGAEHIRIGSHIRIDAFSVLSAGPGNLTIGEHVHLGVGDVGVGVCLYAGAGVTIAPFAGLSSGVSVYSVSDDSPAEP